MLGETEVRSIDEWRGSFRNSHVAIESDLRPLQQEHSHQPGRHVVLVVDGAAAVDIAVFAGGAEGWVLPLRRVDGDDVAVTHDEERPLAPVTLQPRHHVRARGIFGEDLRVDPRAAEHVLQIVGD
jgi:hypothetical protein